MAAIREAGRERVCLGLRRPLKYSIGVSVEGDVLNKWFVTEMYNDIYIIHCYGGMYATIINAFNKFRLFKERKGI